MTTESEIWPMQDEMSLALIRMWCEAVEDANPVYYDPAAAARSRHAGIIAPPTMLMPLCERPGWTPAGRRPTYTESFAAMVPDHPRALAFTTVHTYHRPIRPGDRPNVAFSRTGPGPERDTFRGRGRISEWRHVLLGVDGDVIAESRMSVLHYAEGALAGPAGLPSGAPSGVLHRSDDHRPPSRSLSWSSVQAGDVLAPLDIPLTITRMAKWVAATRDFNPVHHDRDVALRYEAEDMYVGVHFFHALAGRFATDWGGADTVIHRLVLDAHDRCFPGDILRVTGRVTRTFWGPEGAMVDLEVDFVNARRRSHTAMVTVSLPDRG